MNKFSEIEAQIDALSANRKITESKSYDLKWRLNRAILEPDEFEKNCALTDLRAEIKRHAQGVMQKSFCQLMEDNFPTNKRRR